MLASSLYKVQAFAYNDNLKAFHTGIPLLLILFSVTTHGLISVTTHGLMLASS